MKRLLKLTFLVTALTLASCSSTTTSESTGEYVDSSVITTKVKAQLASSKKVSALDVKVKTYKSTVQLSGFVDTEDTIGRGLRREPAVAALRRRRPTGKIETL